MQFEGFSLKHECQEENRLYYKLLDDNKSQNGVHWGVGEGLPSPEGLETFYRLI